MLALFLAALESAEDKRRFAELYEAHHVRMEQIALNILRDGHDAEEAVQNAFLQIIRHFEKIYKIPCNKLPFWIISIVKNESLMLLRKRKKEHDRTVAFEEWTPPSAETVTDWSELARLFAQLPQTYRAALEMRYLLGYSTRDIANRLGISENAVTTRISRGRALLREILEKEGFQL